MRITWENTQMDLSDLEYLKFYVQLFILLVLVDVRRSVHMWFIEGFFPHLFDVI